MSEALFCFVSFFIYTKNIYNKCEIMFNLFRWQIC